MTDSTVIIRVDEQLKTAFADAARATDRTASQILREFMRDYVKSQAEASEYDAWFRSKVEEGIADARAGRVIPNAEVSDYFAKRRAASRKKAARAR